MTQKEIINNNINKTNETDATNAVIETFFIVNNDLGGSEWAPKSIDPKFIDILGLHDGVDNLANRTDGEKIKHIYVQISKESFEENIDYELSLLAMSRPLNDAELSRIRSEGMSQVATDYRVNLFDNFKSATLYIGGDKERLLLGIFEALRRKQMMNVLDCLFTSDERKKYFNEIVEWYKQGQEAAREAERVLVS